MIKAGVNDPSRPIGVFLFVGPTGTGKTEIAKTLARYLFGSAERMIRVDMSELQTAESLDRIVGEQRDGGEGTALVNEIRRQPFSVVLLDEFEKAHPNIWDLFLQVFDDGRLTDRRGKVADFRHAVIIMTSNLGATVPRGASIGFGTTQAGFAPVVVDRAVAETFRREFINRLDRVVVFRPLGRQEMRNILRKELDEVFQRRGLRNRNWAVEWDASAIDFLLDKGFTPDLGARPLKRAIDRYLLTPLAETIVRHEVPAGDQFLFVRSAGDRLDVVFVDPDAPQEPTSGGVATEEAESELDVRQLVLDPHGTVDEVDCLEDRYEDLAEVVESADWQQRKAGALSQLRAAGFWESPHRFAVLGLAEYMDRIEVGLDTARSLLRRLGSANGARQHYPRDLIQRLAEQLHLLDAACKTLAEGRPRDAYLVVRASRDSGTDRAEADVFAARLARMYTEWAANRRMRLEVLEENPGGGAGPYAALFAISGFGAFVILEPESGLHVMESPQDTKSFNRVKARVVVAPQADEPLADPRQACTVAMRAIDGAAESSARVIVRRYREEPSPLVRDAVRGWRTGRIDRVLAGNFDVVS
jgi:ATP-dependent Clp protease ATP-binding subunit ClpC